MIEQLELLSALSLESTLDSGAAFDPQLILCMVIASVFGFGLRQSHCLYNANKKKENPMGRSFLLIVPSLALVFIVIQQSLMLSIGMLGSLSFVHYRSVVKDQDDVGFILLSIALAMSCATNQFDLGFMALSLSFFVSLTRYTSLKRAVRAKAIHKEKREAAAMPTLVVAAR